MNPVNPLSRVLPTITTKSASPVASPVDSQFDEDTQKRMQIARSGGMSEDQVIQKATEYQAKKMAKVEADQNDPLLDALPLIGGIAGSFVPGLGNIVGGALGAGAGALIKNVADKKEGIDTGEVIKETALGGAGGVAGKVLSKVGGKAVSLATKSAPERLMKSVFKEGLKDSKAAVRGGKTLAGEALDRGTRGTEQQILDNASRHVDESENALQVILSKSNKTVSIDKIRKIVNPAIRKYEQAGNINAANTLRTRLANIEATVGSKVPVSRANQIKREIYKEVNDAYGQESTAVKEGLKDIGRGFKEEIENVHDGSLKGQISQLNKDLGHFGRERDAMVDKIARQRNNVIGLNDVIAGSAGFAAAGPAGLVPALALKGLGTTAVKSTGAQALRKAGQFANLPAIKVAGGAGATIAGQAGVQSGEDLLVPTPQVSESKENDNQSQDIHNVADDTLSTQESQTLTGYTPEELYRAYRKARDAGDKASATELRQMWTDETKYQEGVAKQNKTTGKKYSEGDKKFLLAKNEATKALQTLDAGVVKTGKAAAIGSKFGEFFGTQDPTTTDFKAQLSTARTAARNALLGANMSDKEMESYLDAIFSYSNEPAIIRQKLATFISSLQDYEDSIAGTGSNLEDIISGQLPDITL